MFFAVSKQIPVVYSADRDQAENSTIMILSFRTPKKCVVITLKFELCGFTIE